MKYTPGPWTWRWTSTQVKRGKDKDGNRTETIIQADSEIIFDGDNRISGSFYLSAPESEPLENTFIVTCEDDIKPANARLIAAAPDMAEMLDGILKRLDVEATERKLRGDSDVFMLSAVREDIRSLLAGIEGC